MISTSTVLLPILVQSRKSLTPEQVASACLALCPRHPCSALPIMSSLSRGVSVCNLLLQAPQCLSMCFHNHIRDTRGLADHISGQERLDRSRWLQLMQISHRSRPYLIPCHGPELFISWQIHGRLLGIIGCHAVLKSSMQALMRVCCRRQRLQYHFHVC